MNTVSSAERRSFLSFLLGMSLVGVSQCFFLRRVLADSDPAEQLCQKLSSVYVCLGSAQVIGREYLRIVPEEAQKKILMNHICRGSVSNQARLLRSDVLATRKLLQEWIRTDFEAGRTVLVNGWLLSQTESRICALMAIST